MDIQYCTYVWCVCVCVWVCGCVGAWVSIVGTYGGMVERHVDHCGQFGRHSRVILSDILAPGLLARPQFWPSPGVTLC